MRPTRKAAKRNKTALARLQAMFTDARTGKPYPPGITVLPDGTRVLVATYS